MAIAHTFTDESGVSASAGFSGNCDLSIKGNFGGAVALEVQMLGSARWDPVKSWSGFSGGNIDLTLVAGDLNTLYRFRAIGVTGSVECYLGTA